MNKYKPNQRERCAIREELSALRTTPRKSEAKIAAEVGRYLAGRETGAYSGRLGGKPGREHVAGGER